MYEVQSGPPPEREFQPRRYPFKTMNVGDWFFAPNMEAKGLYSHVSTTGKRLGKVFSTRQVYMLGQEGTWVSCKSNTPNAVRGVVIARLK